MKTLFLSLLAVLILAAVAIQLTKPESQSPVPILYWVTDSNPMRDVQIETFGDWQRRMGYLTDEKHPVEQPDGSIQMQRIPKVDAKTDSANRDLSKQIIQGVSGVAGDLFDMFPSGGALVQMHGIGLLRDVTDDAKRLGFGLDKTYPAMHPDLTVDGRQYAFPCNVTVKMLWVNTNQLKKLNQPMPPERWTIEEFERLGKQYVAAANKPGQPWKHFYISAMHPLNVVRSMGLDYWNETTTKPMMNDPRFIKVLKKSQQWTFVDRIMPSKQDLDAASVRPGFGGVIPQLFQEGNIAIMQSGRWICIQFRKMAISRDEQGRERVRLAVVEPPHAGFPVTDVGTRCTGVYIGSKHPELAVLFLSFLASREYNMQIVKDGDSLPPNPTYVTEEEFLKPKNHPEEWGCHEKFANAALTMAVPQTHSPFLLPATERRLLNDQTDAYVQPTPQLTAEQAAKNAAESIERALQRTIQEDPKLRPRYDMLIKLQKKIDAMKAANQKIPYEWLNNPFHRHYYKAKGMTRPATPAELDEMKW